MKFHAAAVLVALGALVATCGAAGVSDYSGPASEYSGPASEYSGPVSGYSGPVNDYSGPVNDYSGPVNDYSGPVNDYSGPVSDYSGPVAKPEPKPAYCPSSDWYHYDSWCYLRVDYNRDYANAEDDCNCRGGYLASVHSQEEMDFIYYHVLGDAYKGNYWIGLSDRCYECAAASECEGWKWTDGTYYDYYDFAYGQPNDRRGYEEDCVEISARFQHKWADRDCAYHNGYVCKAPAAVPEPHATGPQPQPPHATGPRVKDEY